MRIPFATTIFTRDFLRARTAAEARTKLQIKAGTATIIATFNGAGSPIKANLNWGKQVNQACTITGWTLYAVPNGTIIIDVWKGTYAQYPLNSSHSITGGNYPSITNAGKNQGGVTGWTSTSLEVGDFIWFNVFSDATNITQASIVLHIQ